MQSEVVYGLKHHITSLLGLDHTPILQKITPTSTWVSVSGYTHLSFHSIWKCSITFYRYNIDVRCRLVDFNGWKNIDVRCRVKWFTASTMSLHHHILGLTIPQFSKKPPHHCRAIICIRMHPYVLPQHTKVLKHVLWLKYGSGMHSEVVYSVNHHITASLMLDCHLFSKKLPPPLYQCKGYQCKGAPKLLSTAYESAQSHI